MCATLASQDPTGAPCQKAAQSNGIDRFAAAISDVRAQVAAIVTRIRVSSPHARILVVGYPQVYPDTGTCPDLLPLAIGAEYVDVWTASAGHDICADDPWVNGQLTDQDAGLRYHPLAAEQRAVAGLILDML